VALKTHPELLSLVTEKRQTVHVIILVMALENNLFNNGSYHVLRSINTELGHSVILMTSTAYFSTSMINLYFI